jgi:multidrug efflux pump subunit AcrA (membrane-fusion protein)
MTTTVNIVLEGRKDAVSVPNGALRRDSGGTYVLVPAAAGMDRRAVRVGFRGSEFTELLSGVRSGERVVLGPALPCAPAAQPQGAR